MVGKAGESSSNVELSLPSTGAEEGEESDTTTTTYDGEGGVPIGGTFRQFMYAVKFGEPNFLLSGRVNGNSKVLYDREPVERVEKVAPWLTIDSDAYPAVVDGRVQWIVDGYTTTDRYPGSQRESFDAMIDDALQEDQGLQTLPTDEINYMRSAVKATVDAYDGTVTLYAWDESDPILKAWSSAFPDTVLPKSEIPEDLMPHLRYPEDLFKVQRYQLAKYHVTEAGDFYQGNDRWEVPEDPNESSRFQPPYRMFIDEDSDPATPSTWAMTSVFVPRDKGNLASFVSVNSDATSDEFGRMQVLEVTEANASGPGQIANEMRQDEQVGAALTRLNVDAATPPIFGNLLSMPVEDGLISIQPVYAVRAGTSGFPILQYVLVSYDDKVGIGTNLTEALENALTEDGDAEPIEPPDNEPTEPPDNEPTRAAGQQSGPAAVHRRADQPSPGPRRRPRSTRPSRLGSRRLPALPREDRGGPPADRACDRALRAARKRGRPGWQTARPICSGLIRCRNVGFTDAGWSSSVARWAHNPEVAGSNPAPATM